MNVRLQLAGARPSIPKRRSGCARGIYYRLGADGRFSGKQIIADVQWCLGALILAGGCPAYQMVCGSDPVGRFVWDDSGEYL